MAIKRGNIKDHQTTTDDFRERIQPFLGDESAIKALQSYLRQDHTIDREGMYLLQITNNLITNNHDRTKDLYRRIPSEISGGLPSGGRKNIQAALICRADDQSVPQEPRGDQETPGDYTRIQRLIGSWAEQDGCWSDTPDEDQLAAGRWHVREIDGSEARVYFDKKNGKVYKTIDFSHYSQFQHFLDRITIHNAAFGESGMGMKVEGFGLRSDAHDNSGYVCVVSQKYIHGEAPTQEEIDAGMAELGYERSETNPFPFYFSKSGNIAITDVTEANAVVSLDNYGNKRLMVFDCEAYLNAFNLPKEQPREYPLDDLHPSTANRFDSPAWHDLLGERFPLATEQEKSLIYTELRWTGKVEGTVNGKVIRFKDPVFETVVLNGLSRQVYSGDILIGSPAAFQKPHTYEVPPLAYDPDKVSAIKEEIYHLTPRSIPIEVFLASEKFVGDIARYGTGHWQMKDDFRRQLKSKGRIEGLVNGKFVVASDPSIPDNVLVSTPDKIKFMLWTAGPKTENGKVLTPKDMEDLSSGKTIKKDGSDLFFNISKGRIEIKPMQKKLNKKQELFLKV